MARGRPTAYDIDAMTTELTTLARTLGDQARREREAREGPPSAAVQDAMKRKPDISKRLREDLRLALVRQFKPKICGDVWRPDEPGLEFARCDRRVGENGKHTGRHTLHWPDGRPRMAWWGKPTSPEPEHSVS